jgi:transcriptional regulator NrdR family protein
MKETDPNDKGIRCAKCGCAHHKTIRTKRVRRDKIMRQRQCRNCGREFVTYEAAFGTPVDELRPEDLTEEQRQGWLTRLQELMNFHR